MDTVEVDSLPPKTDDEEIREEKGVEEDEDGLYEYFEENLPGLVHAIKMCTKEAGVKCIDVGNLFLETRHMKPIFNILPNTQVTEFNAENNNLPWGMPEFAKQLVKSNVKKLSFKNCRLRVLDVLALMEALQNTQITDLDLSCLSFDEPYPLSSAKKFVTLLTKSHLTHLRLTASSLLRHSSGKDLASHLPQTFITHLWLEQTDLCRDEEALKDLFTNLPKTVITELYLGCNEIEDDQLKPLCENVKQSKLKVLDLHSNKITDAGMNLLSEALVGSKVHQLNVAMNKISGANNLGKHLKDTSITILHLGRNKIENCEMFLPDFLKDTSVTELHLDSCDVGDEVARNLVKCLKSSKVTKIILSANNLGLQTVKEFASTVKETKITEVDFSENDFSTQTLEVLGEGIKGSKLQRLMLRGSLKKLQEGPVIAAFINRLKGTAVEFLDISCTNFENECALLAMNLKNATLTHLNLSSCQIGPGIANLAPVLKFTAVTHLNLSKNKIRDEGAEKLAEVLKETKIRRLEVVDNIIFDRGAKVLVQCLESGSLCQLNLRHNKITSQGIEELVEIIDGTFITNLEVSCDSDGKTLPLITELWRNLCLAHKLLSFFSNIAPADGRNFRFESNFDHKKFNMSVEKCLQVYKTVVEEPSAISVLSNDENIPFSRDQLLELVEGFPRQFVSFIKNVTKLNILKQVKVLERAIVLKLSKIAELMVSDFAALLLKDGLLMPEPFKALEKHKELICSMVSKPENKKTIMEKFAIRPVCGLCGKTSKLTRTDCCKNWICDDSDQYVMFSYARNSCYRNHDRYTLCSYHHNERHGGRWQDCKECKEDFAEENYIDYVTNDYNFEKLENVERVTIECANCGFQSEYMEDFSMNSVSGSGSSWFCKKKECLEKGYPGHPK